MESKAVVIATLLYVIGVATVAASRHPVSIVRCEGMSCYDSRGKESLCIDDDIICCAGPGIDEWRVQYPDIPGLQCCYGSGKLYNKASEVCVNGTKRLKTSPNEFECGATETYNSDTHDCCKNNETYGRVYTKVGGQCCNDTYLTDPNTACCEGTIYNRSEKTCCESVTHARHLLYDISYGECCGSQAYDPKTQKCGDYGVEFKSSSELAQCNNATYNPKMHLCCGGLLVTLANHLCYQGREIVPKSNQNDNQVCKVKSGQLVTFFNGTDIGHRKVCIPGKRVLQLSRDEAKCLKSPTGVYNTTTDLCCLGGKYYKGGRLSGLKCCEGSTLTFNPNTQTCCRNKIHNSVSEKDGGSCCEKRAFNSKTHFCDKYRVIKERCNLSTNQIEELRASFLKGGLSVYVGTVLDGPFKRGKEVSWKITNVEQLTGKPEKAKKDRKKSKKKGLIIMSKVGEQIYVKVKGKCPSPSDLEIGERYVFLSSKPVKKHALKMKVKDSSGHKKNTDAVISLKEAKALGTWIQILFGRTNNS